MKSISVFCGSNPGKGHQYADYAAMLGARLAKDKIQLVYGGGKVGLMGALAQSCLDHGGRVLGVIPGFLLDKEVGFTGLTELIVTKDMHERKRTMLAYCDAVLAMPGGVGTLDELFEMVTWAQLHLHEKPIGILNINGYFDLLLRFIDHMVDEGFLTPPNKRLFLVDDDLGTLLAKMASFTTDPDSKRLDTP